MFFRNSTEVSSGIFLDVLTGISLKCISEIPRASIVPLEFRTENILGVYAGS